MGWTTSGTKLDQVSFAHRVLTVRRVVRSTSKLSMCSKRWHKHLRRRRPKVWLLKLLLKSISDGCQKLRQLCSKRCRRTQVTQTRLQTTLCSRCCQARIRTSCYRESSLIFIVLWDILLISASRQSQLQLTAPQHALLSDLQEKSALFDQAATKYTAKVVAQ